MRSLLPLSIVLFAACTPVSAQTYTVLHNFGSQPETQADPPHWDHRPESWRRDADYFARSAQSMWARRSGYGPAVPSRWCINFD